MKSCLSFTNIANLRAEYRFAETRYKEALNRFTSIEHVNGVVEVHLKLGAVNIQKGEYGAARIEFQSALSEAKEHGLYLACIDAHLGLGQGFQRLGQYHEALDDFSTTH